MSSWKSLVAILAVVCLTVSALGLTWLPLAMSAEKNSDENGLRAKPFEFDPDHLGIVFAKWENRLGLPDAEGQGSKGLVLSKNGATSANAAAGAVIEKVDGTVLTQLGFDVRSGGHCGAGAPRFNVVVNVGVTPTLFFIGCSAGAMTPVPGVDPAQGWMRVRFSDQNVFAADGKSAWPGFGTAVARSIAIVFDEGTDIGPDFSGMVILDNIDISGSLITSTGGD